MKQILNEINPSVVVNTIEEEFTFCNAKEIIDINDNNLAIIIIDLLLCFETRFPENPPSRDHGNNQLTFANVTFSGESVSSYIIIIIKGR